MEKKQKKKILVLIIVLAIVIVLCIGIFIFLHFNNNCNDNDYYTNILNTTDDSNLSDEEKRLKKILEIDAQPTAKPIIYLYPSQETKISVKLGNSDELSCSYPNYINGWNVTAYPDGTLIDNDTERELYALYWEGKDFNTSLTDEGFIVKSEDTINFLEEKLEILGLSYKESEEFIVYWLPKLQESNYNYIKFTSLDELNNYMPLEFSIEPDTLIRVHMQFKHLDSPIEVTEQKLEKVERNGFTIVEWGGSEIK